MKLLAGAVAGLGLVVAVFNGCGGEPDHPERTALGSTQQALAFVPPNNGGVLLVAGTGERGLVNSADPKTGALNDPAAVLVRPTGSNPPSKYLVVADWGNNTIRDIIETGDRRGISQHFAFKNLLANPRAEIADATSGIPGWTIDTRSTYGGEWQAVTSPCPGCGDAAGGNRLFYAGRTGNAPRLTQSISVAEWAQATDFGFSQFCFTGLVRSAAKSPPDTGRIFIQSYDGGTTGLGTVDSGDLASPNGWTPIKFDWTLPKGTRRLVVNLMSSRAGCAGCSADAYFDELQLIRGSCEAPDFVSRPEAFASTPLLVIGGKDICYDNQAARYICPSSYRDLYVQSLAAGKNRLYAATITQGIGYIALDATGVPTGPFTKLFDSNPTPRPLGWANGLAVEQLPSGDRLYFSSAWQPDPELNFWRGGRLNIYDCNTGSTCERYYEYSTSTGFRDAVSGAVGNEAFLRPRGLGMGRYGDLFVADSGNNAIRRVFSQFVTTIGGSGVAGNTGNGGSSVAALFSEPSGINVDTDGTVYIADRANNQIRKIVCAGNDVCANPSRFNPATATCDALPPYPKDDGNPCTDESCYVTAIWRFEVNNGRACGDNDACNGNEACWEGVCKPGTPPVVTDDNNSCTADYCDPAVGVVHKALAANSPCVAASSCVTPGTCNSAANCVVGVALPTDDLNPCTADSCGATGVTHTPIASGTSCGTAMKCDGAGACISTNVGSLNPLPLDRTLPTPAHKLFGDLLATNGGFQSGSRACVYDSTHPTCAFVPMHMALVRGTVADTAGTGLAGVTISVLNHPEFGTTTSLANGEYFIVVNGGAPLTIRANKTGLLQSDRMVNPVWGGTDFAQDIVLVPLDGVVTAVTFSTAGGSKAWGSNVQESGTPARQASVFFPSGVQVATSSGIVPSAKFRVTEYTVGANGQARMPANVAANTAYTYAAEFTLEDANGTLYDNVTFSTPVMVHLTNFLNMTEGDTVPVGYYDRVAGNWQPMPNGRVIKVDATTGAVSGLQTGDPAVSADELQKLASFKGTTLWRLPLSHFSPLDFNLGIGAPACDSATVCAGPLTSPATGGEDSPACGSCPKTGSIIDVERQVLRETLPVVGTPFSLNYSSENTLGYAWSKTLGVNLENHPKHSKLLSFKIDFKVAGKHVVQGSIYPSGTGVYPSWTWPKKYEATWDGRDQDGRAVQGAATATLDVGAVYLAERRGVQTFGSGAGNVAVMPMLTGTRELPTITIWTRFIRQLQAWDASALGFGGWSLSVHHTFDPVGNVIYMGDGTHRKIDIAGAVITPIAGTLAAAGTTPDGTLASAATFREIQGMVVGRDGDIFVAIPGDNVVRKLSVANGQYTVADYAGKTGVSNLPFTAADGSSGVGPVGGYLLEPNALALHDDGRLVISDRRRQRVYVVGLDGKLRTFAGRGDGSVTPTCGVFNEGTLATLVDLCNPYAVAAGPDGSVYILDYRNGSGGTGYVMRVDQLGRAWLVAGKQGATSGFNYYRDLAAAGTPANQMGIWQSGISVDRNNVLWLSTDTDLVAVNPDLSIRDYQMPQRALTFSSAVDLGVFPNGDLLRPVRLLAGSGAFQLQRCSPNGKCAVIAGASAWEDVVTTLGNPAVGNQLQRIDAIATMPDDSTVFATPNRTTDGWRILRITPPLVASSSTGSCVYKVPATDGSEYYCFDGKGQHQTTVNAFTNGTTRIFKYDAAGLLSKIIEGAVDPKPERTTTIDRSTSTAVKIISPNSQTTQINLDAKKVYATSISGAGTVVPAHDANNGLLTTLTDADGQPHSFAYDNFGRLQRDTDPASGYQFLTRTETASGKYTVAVTTAMGKTDWFSREILSNGDEQRVFGLLNGLTKTTTRDGGGTNTTDLADGTRLTQTPGADPRWGMLAPFTAKTTFGQAGTVKLTTSTTRTSVGTTPIITDQITVAGATTRTYQRVYSTAANTLTLSSPLGRQVTYTFDGEGRVASVAAPGTPQIDFAVNAVTGRIDKVSQGTGRVVDLTYSPSGANKGFLTAVNDPHISTNANALSTAFAPDGNGRPLSSTRQSLITSFDWTPSGLLKSVTPPGKPAHTLAYDARGLLKTYTPPTLGGTDEKTTFNLDLDRYLQSVEAPGEDDLRIVTDPVKGRTTSILVGGQSIGFNYYGAAGDASCTTGCAPGHLSTIVDGRSATTTTFKWDASLLSSIGEAGGTVSWTYNNDLRRTEEKLVKGAHTSAVGLGYDLDGLLTCASLGACVTSGPGADQLTIARNATSGRVSGLTLGTGPTETFSYNSYGELWYHHSGALHIEYEDLAVQPNGPRDEQGRVRYKYDRTTGVGAKTLNYSYDEQGRLWKVDGSVTSEYRYDGNGNRIYARNFLGIVDGASGNITYDPQDRLTKYGTTTFDYTPKGDIYHRYTSRGTTTYDYDALGALRHVVLPDGRTIEYLVDGFGRRIGKKMDGQLAKQWFYGTGMGPLAEADGAGTIRMRFVYGSKSNVPDVVKTYTAAGAADKIYRVSTDQLGTPRVIVDAAGTIFEATDYDEFGIMLSDTNPTFDFPFGFAGGIYDADTKLTRFGARDYDASIGRWVSKDPILFGGGQANLYVYAANDPVNRADPSGLDSAMVPLDFGPFYDMYDDAARIRQLGHQLYPGEVNSAQRHQYGARQLASLHGEHLARAIGILNEIQGFLWHDIWNLRSRVQGRSPWAFQLDDMLQNEEGIAQALEWCAEDPCASDCQFLK